MGLAGHQPSRPAAAPTRTGNNGGGGEEGVRRGLTGEASRQLLLSDPALPPRISRRDRSFYCFHLDLSAESQYLLPSLVRYMIAYGARHSTFLDINVTHIITDKPIAVVAASPIVRKLGCKILGLADFLKKIIESYARPDALLPSRPPLSPTMRKAAGELKISQQPLAHFLAEERRQGVAMALTRTTRAAPLYNAAAGGSVATLSATAAASKSSFWARLKANERGPVGPAQPPHHPAATPLSPPRADPTGDEGNGHGHGNSRLLGTLGDKKIVFEPFKHPFLLLEEITHTFAPVFKEYAPGAEGGPTFPILNLAAPEFYCPWGGRHQMKHVGENQQALAAMMVVTATKNPPVLVPSASTTRHRAAKTVRTLAMHRSNYLQTVQNRPKALPKAVGLAPIPTIIAQNTPKAAERPRPGFCECCYEKYSNLERHVKGDAHRKLVSNSEFYRVVDRVLWTLARPLARPETEQHSPVSQRTTPLSPAKSLNSVSGQLPLRVKSVVPLRNITNQIPPPAATTKLSYTGTAIGLTLSVPALAGDAEQVMMGAQEAESSESSESPIISSPSLKRRRSQRLVGRATRIPGKFVL